MRETRLYIAGPMTGYENFNYPFFEEVAASLRGMGFNIESPVETDPTEDTAPGTMPYEWYLKSGLRKLLDCTGIIMLPGWTKSTGAKLELQTALAVNLDLFQLTRTGKGSYSFMGLDEMR